MGRPQQTIQARARLALRSERALGLTALPVRLAPSAAIQSKSEPCVKIAPTPAQAPLPPREKPPSSENIDVRLPAKSPLMPPPSKEPFSAPLLSTEQKIAALQALDANEVRGCTRCRLCQGRTRTVFGEGDPDARLFFIGEGPGENEDLTGRPFVGRAGDKLNEMISAMGLSRERVYIANIVKCRPPQNRAPVPDEVATCTPYLERQLEIIRPQVIVTLGLPASKYMLQSDSSMGRLRGNWHTWRGIKLMPTYHPAYILRNYTPQTRAAVWSDLQQVMAELGLPIAKRGKT